MIDSIHTWVQTHRTEIIESVRRLVAINTENHAPYGNEQSGQMAVAGMLNVLGCEVDTYAIGSVPGLLEHPYYWAMRPGLDRDGHARHNVMGIRRGTGGGKSLMFSSHMDTMPVGPDAWSKDPFGSDSTEERLWGVGSYDMKAGLAASIMAVKALNDLGIELKGDVMVESVIDEEYGGCNGTLAARLKYNADLAIVPEPTNLIVCPAHHGGLMLRVTFFGKPGWGFSPDKPVDPVNALGRFIVVLNEWAAQRNATVPVPALYANNHSLPVLVNQVKAGEVNLPIFAARVPSNAWLTAWIETYPGEGPDAIIADLMAYYQQAQSRDAVLARFEPEYKPLRFLNGSGIDPQHAGVQTVANAVLQVRGSAVVQGAPFACDGHIFNLYSTTPMVLCGPIGGGPHAPDEYIDLDPFLDLVETFIRTAVAWCG